MKKSIVVGLAVTVLAAAAGGVWLHWRSGDPLTSAKALIATGDLRGALLDLRTAVREHPDNAEARFRLGALQLRTGDPVAAERELTEARVRGFAAADVAAALDQAYLAQGKLAAILAEPVPQGVPPAEMATILVARGMAQAGLKQPEAADATLAEAAKLAPDSAEPPLAQARAAALRDDRAAALAAATRALAIDAKRSDAQLLKARLLAAGGERDAALAMLDVTVAQTPTLLAARLLRADLLLAAGQGAKAKPDVLAVLAAEPKNATALFLRAALQSQDGDEAGADTTLESLSGQLSQFPRGYFVQAMVKQRLRQFAQATDAAEKFLAHNPKDPAAVKLFAQIALQSGFPGRALEALQRARDGGMLDAGILDLLGRAYAATGRTEQAQHSFEQAVALPPSPEPGPDALHAAVSDAPAVQYNPAQLDAEVALVLSAIDTGDVEQAEAGIAQLRRAAEKSELAGDLTGLLKLSRFDLAGAHAAFTAVLAAHPDSLRAKLNLAKTANLQGQRVEAEALLGGILAQQPANPAALLAVVPMLLQDGQSGQALAIMAGAHAAAPDNLGLTTLLSELYVRVGQPEKALALDQGPAGQYSPPALLGAQARAEIALGRRADAAETYRHVLAAVPANRDARTQLAALLSQGNDAAGAAQLLRDGLKLTPGDADLMSALLDIELKRGGATAGLAAAAALAADPANLPAARTLKGDVLMRLGRFDEAAAAFAAERSTTPSSELTLRTAQALQAAGHADQAAQLLRDRLAQQPEDWSAVSLLANFDIIAGRLDAGAADLERLLAHQPNAPAALNNLAWIEQQRGDGKQARAHALRAFFLAPTPQITDTLAWILVQDGEPGTGAVLLRRALAGAGKDPVITYHLAAALKATEQPDQARQLLEPLLASDARFNDRVAAQRLLGTLSK